MRIILISPPNTLEKNSVEQTNFENRITPLDLAIIGAVLEKGGHEVKILDALARRMSLPQILSEIHTFNPKLVCVTAFDRCRWGADIADKLSREIKLKEGAKLGLLWSFKPDLMKLLMKQSPNISFSIIGDPEFTLLDIANGKRFKTIKGLIYKEGTKLIENPLREPIKDLDLLPIPARHLLDFSLYKRLPHELIKEPCYDLAASRGCPYQCIFCLLNVVWGNSCRMRSPKKVVEEIKLLISEGAKQIHFQDLTFTLSRTWTVELCELIIKEDLNIIWDCQTRVDKVDLELLILMKKAGCESILYGIESLNQTALDKIKKGVTTEAIEKALENTRKAGIETRCSMMLGLPGETKESVEKTLSLLLKWNPAFVQFHTTIAFPGTELYNGIEKYGKIAGDKMVRKLDLTGNPFVPYGYNTEKELLNLQKHAYLKFYLRPKYLFGKILTLKNFKRNIQGLLLFLKLTRT
jgi:anaerobic magnesium-protoporphyrin IX monomethyl ester cyclase